MPYLHFSRFSALHQDLTADIRCTFPGIPGTYRITTLDDLRELAADPVRFAADLAAFGTMESTPRLEGRNAHILLSPVKTAKPA